MAGKMGSRSNYSDPVDTGPYSPTIYKDKRHSERAYTPSDSESDEGVGHSKLAEDSLNGNWSWKPERNSAFPQFEMPAFKGVPPSAAELYGRVTCPRT